MPGKGGHFLEIGQVFSYGKHLIRRLFDSMPKGLGPLVSPKTD